MKTHPHNANPEAYARATEVAFDALTFAKRATDVGYALTFSTIEATDARADAVELNRAAETLRAASEAFCRAACRTYDRAQARADTLAAVEGRDDEDRDKPLPPRVANREARQAYAAAKAAGKLPPASQPNEIPEIGENP